MLPEEIAGLLDRMDGVLFLDNAYVDFSDLDYRALMRDHDNLIIGRTMSKIYALAGLRIGYAFLPEWLVGPYAKAATPFAVSTVAAAAAEAALGEREWSERISRPCAYLAGAVLPGGRAQGVPLPGQLRPRGRRTPQERRGEPRPLRPAGWWSGPAGASPTWRTIISG